MDVEELAPIAALKERRRKVEENVPFALAAASAAYAYRLWIKENWYMFELTRASVLLALGQGCIEHLSVDQNEFVYFVSEYLVPHDEGEHGTDDQVFLAPIAPLTRGKVLADIIAWEPVRNSLRRELAESA